MTGSNKSKDTATSAENLTKTSPKGSVELSEAALNQASGGAVFPSSPTVSALKIDSSLKLDKWVDPNLVLQQKG